MLDAVVGWVLERVVDVALGAIIGAFGAKWWFGKKNQEKLDELQRRITHLEREKNDRPRREPSAAASPESATQSPAPQSPLEHSALKSGTLPSSAQNALLAPKELIDLVAGRTKLVAERLLEPHIGLRHFVTGEVEEVGGILGTVDVEIRLADGIAALLAFDRERYYEELAVLRQGDEISASGLLRTVRNFIALEKCSLEKVLSAPSRS